MKKIKYQNGGQRSKAYVFAEKQKDQDVQPFEIEGENLRKYYAKNNPNVDVEVIPFYGEDEFNSARQKIGNFSEQDEVFLFGHSGNTLGGVPHTQIADSLKEGNLKTCYAGSCNFEGYSDPYKDLQNFYYRGKDQWLGVNPNSNNIISAMFSKSNDYESGEVRAIKPEEGNQYNRVFNRPQQNTIAPPQRDNPFLRNGGGVIKDDNGYWNPNNWGHPVEINSNRITMQGVNEPLIGVSDTGNIQMMQPGREYLYEGKKVTEFPINSVYFNNLENLDDMKANKKPIKKGQFGLAQGLNNAYSTIGQQQAANNLPNIEDILNPKPYAQNSSVPNIRGSVGMVPQAGELGNNKSPFDFNKAIGKAAPIAGDLIQGFQMMKDQKRQLQSARQWQGVSTAVRQASESRPEEIQRQYVRPEDIPLTGDELFPTYGTGTNVLKYGGIVKGNKAQFGETFSNANITNFAESGGGDILSNIYRGIAGESGGGKIGGTIGKVAGKAIGGPIGGMIGQVGGEVIGELLDQKEEKIAKARKAIDNNISAIGINAATQGMQRNNFSFMQSGGEVPSTMNNEVIPLWGGSAETLSVNPYLPNGGETVMFKGQSHTDSDGKGNNGIGIMYGKNPIEVEGGEPALKLKNGSNGSDSLVVYGNVKINKDFSSLLGDPDATGKKFKNYVADLSEQENKSTKILDNSVEKIGELESITPFDKLKESSMKANIEGSNMKLQGIADKKMNAAFLQEAINQDAEEKKIKITNDGDIRNAKDGITIAQNGIVSDKDYDYLVDLYQKAMGQGEGPAVEYFQQEFSRLAPERAKSILANYPVTNYGKARSMSNTELQSNYDSIFGKRTEQYIPDKARELSDLGVTPINPNYPLPGNTDVISKFPETEYKRSALLDAVGQVLPFVRPSDAENLNPRQLAGEMYAMSTNQLQPVQAQTYTPQLNTPYNVSYQDILNENRLDTQSAQRLYGYNPAAQSIISAQGYEANQKVLGEEFRANQKMQDSVYSGNRTTMNDAQIKNLAIFDQQYGRQAKAASNTKAVNQAAISSIADKYTQNQLENRTLQAYENLYNYRFDNRGRAVNMNAPHQFDIPTIDGLPQQIDEQGNVITTREQTRVARDAFGRPKGSLTTSEVKSKKSYQNGNIVKMVHEM